MATIRNSNRLDRKLGALARGQNLTPQMKLAAEIPREAYIKKVQNITGSRTETRYHPTREVTVSDPGQAPNNDLGHLVSRAEVVPLRINAVSVENDADYAIALELGTRKMAARPALGPAFDETLKKVTAQIAKAILQGMRKAVNGA